MNASRPISRTSRILAASLCGALALVVARAFPDAPSARRERDDVGAALRIPFRASTFRTRTANGFDAGDESLAYLDGTGLRVDPNRVAPELASAAQVEEIALASAESTTDADSSDSASETDARLGADFEETAESELSAFDATLGTGLAGADFAEPLDDADDRTNDFDRDVAWGVEVRMPTIETPDFNDVASQPDWQDEIELDASAYAAQDAFDETTPQFVAPALAERIKDDQFRRGSSVFVAESNAEDVADVPAADSTRVFVAKPNVDSARGTNRPVFVEAQRVGAFVAPGTYQTAILPAQDVRR